MSLIDKVATSLAGSLIASGISHRYLVSKTENTRDTTLQSDQFPNITILLPTLNEEWMIEKTLQSIKNQNIYRLYPERFEILLVDSNSEDNTVEIAKNYADKIILMEERNLISARTIGVNQSRGDLIVFIDADTIYPINWLNSMLKHYLDYQVIAVSGLELHPNFNILVNIFEPIAFTLATSLGAKLISPMIGHNSSCYKYAFNLVEGFSVPFEYDIKNEFDTQKVLEIYFAEKLKKVGKYIYDPQLIVYDYGGKRRVFYNNRKQLYNKTNLTEEEKYLSKYWKERESRTRF